MRLRSACALLALAICGCGDGRDAARRVVFVTWDTTRADRLGCYGYDKPISPNLDAFAEEAVLFENAVSQVPTTLPSHSTMFTGLYPQDHGVRYNLVFRLDDEADTLAERMRAAGYRTAGFPASFVLQGKYGLAQGFDLYVEPIEEGVTDREANYGMGGSRSAAEGVDAALAWLAAQGDSKTFLWLHFYDPHSPYRAPFPYSSEYRDHPYDGEIAYTDAEFGRLMRALRSDPAWDETIVVVAGDHGEGLHDHRERWHSYLVYETTQHVPLVIRVPGAAPRRVARPVELADLMPTVLDLVGAPLPEHELRGVSLRPALLGEPPPERFLYFETHAGALNYGWQELAGVRFREWKLIDSSEPELYDVAADPAESNNLAGAEPERVARFREELARVKAPVGDLTAGEMDTQLSPEEERRLRALGYVAGGEGEVGENARTPQDMIDLEAEIARARVATANGHWEYVEELCRYILDRDSTNKWALTNLTHALIDQGRVQEADEPSRRLVEHFHDNANSWATRGRALSAMGRPEKAYEDLRNARDSKALADSEAIAYFLLVAGFDAGAPVCEADLPAALAQFAGSPRIQVMKARCDLRGPDGVNVALDTLENAVRLGYRDLATLEAYDEFKPVVEHERFAALRELASREGGDGPEVQVFPGTTEAPAPE